mmetsp:Transcript_28394/g.50549  ORF Transcript_28394/g.50549 Transcript_28394/m.50549 type:complete len:173 (-) Transcript_28394:13-531(-)
MEQATNYRMRLITVGEPNVGKTSLIYRHAESEFGSGPHSFDFKKTSLTYGGARVEAFIWDTASAESFGPLSPSYYRNTDAAALVFDLTSRATFGRVKYWDSQIRAHASAGIGKVLVGSKCDLSEERQVSFEEAKALADELGIQYIEVSAKEATNVHELFVGLVALSPQRLTK